MIRSSFVCGMSRRKIRSAEIRFPAGTCAKLISLGAEKFGWKNRPAAIRSQRDGAWLIGQGVATGTYPMYRMITAARVRINVDGTAVVASSAQEMGMGTATVQTQYAAELLGLPMEKVRFDYGDSTLPWASVAGGSSQTVSIALAVQQASEKLRCGTSLACAKGTDVGSERRRNR